MSRFIFFLLGLVALIALCIILALRPATLGSDYDNYEAIFTAATTGIYLVEPFFSATGLIFGLLGFNFHSFLFFIACLSFSLKYLLIIRITQNRKLTSGFFLLYFLSFFWLYDISQIRAGLMLSFLPYAFLTRWRIGKLLTTTGAISTHFSAILVLTSFLKRKTAILALVLLILVGGLGWAALISEEIFHRMNGYSDKASNWFFYLVHPFFLLVVVFLFFLSQLRVKDILTIDINALKKFIFFIAIAYIYLLRDSRTTAFRVIEIGFYVSFLFSYTIFCLTKKRVFLLISVSCVIIFVLMSYLIAESPIVNFGEL